MYEDNLLVFQVSSESLGRTESGVSAQYINIA